MKNEVAGGGAGASDGGTGPRGRGRAGAGVGGGRHPGGPHGDHAIGGPPSQVRASARRQLAKQHCERTHAHTAAAAVRRPIVGRAFGLGSELCRALRHDVRPPGSGGTGTARSRKENRRSIFGGVTFPNGGIGARHSCGSAECDVSLGVCPGRHVHLSIFQGRVKNYEQYVRAERVRQQRRERALYSPEQVYSELSKGAGQVVSLVGAGSGVTLE
eukprot:70082-Prorocentrum_minimum.AAC.1